MNIEEKTKCRVTGWGATRTRGPAVDDLRVVDVSVTNRRVCQEIWGRLPANIICAGGYNTTRGFCQVCLSVYKKYQLVSSLKKRCEHLTVHHLE